MARILVIDDDAAIRRLLQRILVDAGHVVQEAADGKHGFSAYRQEPSDLVITDLVMPDMEGLELIRALRHHDASVKILAMSGGDPSAARNYLKVALKFGAGGALAKPFSNQEFLDAVKTALADAPPA